MLLAKEYLGEVGVGATSPLFFRADDDRIYIVKLLTNPLGGKVLASEQIAASFGRILGLPFPASEIFSISDDWLRIHPIYSHSAITAGYHFASCYLPDVSYATSAALPHITNRNELAGIILFDHLLHNGDRAQNRRNILLHTDAMNATTLYGIDHSHLFHSGRWTIDSLARWEYRIATYTQNLYGILLDDWLSASDFRPYADAIAHISDDTLKGIIRSIPRQWLPDIEERTALFRFLRIRRDLVYRICERIYQYIPTARGGTLTTYATR